MGNSDVLMRAHKSHKSKQIEISSTDDIDMGAPDSKKSCNSSFETFDASIPMIVEYEFRTEPDMHACLLVLCSADVCDVFTALTHACSITIVVRRVFLEWR